MAHPYHCRGECEGSCPNVYCTQGGGLHTKIRIIEDEWLRCDACGMVKPYETPPKKLIRVIDEALAALNQIPMGEVPPIDNAFSFLQSQRKALTGEHWRADSAQT